MSGGHFEYRQYQVREIAEAIQAAKNWMENPTAENASRAVDASRAARAAADADACANIIREAIPNPFRA